MPFVLLILALLGGGLICLLVINTTLGATSFQIDRLQEAANAQSLQAQYLEQQIAAHEAPARIAQEAYALGMRPQQHLVFLDLRTHRVYSERAGQRATAAAAVAPQRSVRARGAARRAAVAVAPHHAARARGAAPRGVMAARHAR
jgi:hypothetical protein